MDIAIPRIIFFLNDTATPKIYPLSLHDALPISGQTIDHAQQQYRTDRDPREPIDRKSTRLNSSHVEISYAVFCLKKKIVELVASLGASFINPLQHLHLPKRLTAIDHRKILSPRA